MVSLLVIFFILLRACSVDDSFVCRFYNFCQFRFLSTVMPRNLVESMEFISVVCVMGSSLEILFAVLNLTRIVLEKLSCRFMLLLIIVSRFLPSFASS